MEEKLEQVTNYFKKYKVHIDNISEKHELITQVYNMCFNNYINRDYNGKYKSEFFNFVGLYYDNVLKDKENAVKYYQIGIDNNYSWAYCNMANLYTQQYFHNINKNEETKKLIESYYLKSVESNNVHAMHALGVFYHNLEPFLNTEKYLKYFNMAVEKGNVESMLVLAQHYSSNLSNSNKELSRKYFLMAIENKCKVSMHLYGKLCEKYDDHENAIKYYKMAIENENKNALISLCELYFKKNLFDDMVKEYSDGYEKKLTDTWNPLIELIILTKNNELIDKYSKLEFDNNNFLKYNTVITYYVDYNVYSENIIKYANQFGKIGGMVGSLCFSALSWYIKTFDKFDELMKFDKEIVNNIIKHYDYKQIYELSKKYDIKPNTNQYQFMKNKYNFSKVDTCSVCFNETTIIPYDCLGHYYCEDCYHKMNNCPMCNIKKHEIMISK